jgi:hypothetical protein
MPQVGVAITAFFVSAGASAATAAWLTAFVGRIALSIGFSVLARALQKKPTFQTPGITTEATQTGGTDPQAFVLGRYATGGQLVTPPMTHGQAGQTPNAYLTYVIAVTDAPRASLSRLFIDGEVATVGGTAHPDYGTPVTLKGVAGTAWIKWYDGSQTAADPMLIAKYGAHPQRPWTTDMVGTGVAHAILTFRFDRKLYKSFPSVRFEVDGVPLYDPRKDPSRGGTGSQSWSNPATWSQTDNPAVMIYNILRGVTMPGGDVWGGGWAEGDLPLSDWVAAMNECDDPIALSAGGTEPRYRAGLEVPVDQEPAAVIEELLKSCAGRIADIGGTMKLVAGAPGVPVKAITDDDIIITDEQSQALFPSLAQTYNGVHASFPDPASLWESRDAPPRYDATAETADGRRLIATVLLPACPWANQVQRLMQAWIAEERRFRRHQLVLPPDTTILEPHDVISWTSVRNGYSAKLFEVAEIVHDPVSLLQAVSLREVDPADYDWNTSLELPWVAPVPGASLPPAQTVPSFAATGTALDDNSGNPRRPAILLTWDGTGQDDVSALEYELRLLGGTQVAPGATLSVASGSLIISAGILPGTNYQVRARFVAPRPVTWTAWVNVTTPATYITLDDFSNLSAIFTAAGLSVPTLVGSLPAAGPARYQGELVYLLADNKLYRWDGAQWTATVPTTDLTGRVASSQLLIADLSNLCEDPGFELAGAGWGAVGGMSGYAILSTDARTGAKCAARPWGGATGNFAVGNNMVFDARAGGTFRISGYVKRNSGGVCTDAGVRLGWLDAAGASISNSAAVLVQASLTTSYQRVSAMVTAPAGAVYARIELIVNGHTAGTFFWDDVYCYRANGGELIVDGSIFGNQVAANSMTAGLFAAGAVKAGDMEIDDVLTMSALGAGFQMGKASDLDYDNSGLYMGRVLKSGGGTGFGFLMGSTSAAGVQRHIRQHEDTGLEVVNAQFRLFADVTSAPETTYTTNQTGLDLTGKKTLNLTLQAAGGRGDTAISANYSASTVVQLFDGTTLIQTWTATGGRRGGSSTINGQNSPYGTGGTGAYRTVQNSSGGPEYTNYPATAGTGYGAGGGGPLYGKGGGAGQTITVSAYDLSALTAPNLTVTIGARDTVGAGANGSVGMVKVKTSVQTLVPAGVIPFAPTASGTFTKGANAAGVGTTIFPDFGNQKGFWTIHNNAGTGVLGMTVKIDAAGTLHTLTSLYNFSFVSDIRPEITASDATARTIKYSFYRMSVD